MNHKLFRRFCFDKFADQLSTEEVVRVFNELYQIRWKLALTDEAKFFLENNNVSLKLRKEMLVKFLDCLGTEFSTFTLVCLFYLLEERLFQRLGYFINVLKVFYANERNLMLVEVISRFELGDVNLLVYKASLEFLYQKQVEYIFKKDDSLLGGFRLRWFNGELDLTVRKQLNRIRQTILQGR